jgi:hypothetical protein
MAQELLIPVNLVGRELSGGYSLLKHEVQLRKCAILCFWKTEEAPNCSQERQTSPKEGLNTSLVWI